MLKLQLTSPDGGTLSTEGTYCEDDIEIVPKLQDKTVTENGTVTADEGYAGMRSVTVNVPAGTTGDNTLNLNNVENGSLLVSTILGLFSQGGGTQTVDEEMMNNIVFAFDGKNFVEFAVDSLGYTIKCPVTAVRSNGSGTLGQVTFTFLIDYSNLCRVTVILKAYSLSDNLEVLVESGDSGQSGTTELIDTGEISLVLLFMFMSAAEKGSATYTTSSSSEAEAYHDFINRFKEDKDYRICLDMSDTTMRVVLTTQNVSITRGVSAGDVYCVSFVFDAYMDGVTYELRYNIAPVDFGENVAISLVLTQTTPAELDFELT